MKPRWGMSLLMLALALCGLTQAAAALPGVAVNRAVPNSCEGGNLSGVTTVHAAQRGAPFLNLCDGHALGNLAGMGQAQPLALASGDFDEDGVPDLVSGFAVGKGGVITMHRGNVNALWPYGAALRNGPPPAFLPNARTFAIPEAPNFIAAGDFDADGHWDVVTAQLGSSALYFLKGDGHGGFAAPQRIPLPGSVTAMIAGEFNRADGLTDLIVAVNGAGGPQVLVFESAQGALKDQPEIFTLPKPATALALGRFDGDAMNDLAVAAGNQIVLIHARDRKTSLDATQRATVAPAKITVQSFSYSIKALVTGDFTGTSPTVAALGNDGSVHVLEHTVSLTTPGAKALLDPNFQPAFQLAKPGPDGKPLIASGRITPGLLARQAALRQALQADANSPEWTERSVVALPSGFAQASPRLVAAHLTGSGHDDIVVPDSGNSKIHVLSTHYAGEPSTASRMRELLANPSRAAITPASMQLLDSLDAVAAPAAVLPMRLNRIGLSGLVALQAGQASPTLMPQTFPAANIFTVTNTLDITSVGSTTVPPNSLRDAINNANAATGPALIQFDIPTTDPGYNAATNSFLIQPLSSGTVASLNIFALPAINNTITIDGYTQPGASPNTLTTSDNAVILIRIDGSLSTTPGNDGLIPYSDDGSTIRGLDFTSWTNYGQNSGNSFGADGVEEYGVGDFIEGNFLGTDTTGKTSIGNHIGVFVDAGPEFGTAPGNIVGGTTPQARNLASGNLYSGILVLGTADQTRIEGNFVGTDITGASLLSNSGDGIGTNGETITFGGALPGAGNLIAGNGTNVDLNDLLDGGLASNSLVQGNLIGTDGTGTQTHSFSTTGVSILHNPQYMTIGGTTPAARNIISGNTYGVYVYDNSFYNNIQGNYIGTDITGTKPLGNVLQGYISGATVSTAVPAGDNNLGGSAPGAGNVISGGASDGISISGTSGGPDNLPTCQGNVIQGNFIGTDYTGRIAIPNAGNGIYLGTQASSNVIGGSTPGAGNLIANNGANGVLIDPGTPNGCEGVANNTVANTILSNTGAGVRINSGTNNLISKNSIFGNGNLGINLDGAGPNLNTSCQSTNTGANDMQNAPVLTAGSGSAFITATATDPNNNTSEFSNAVPASESGNLLNLLGTFNSTPNTTYTIEFFSSPSADPSGYGQGQTYLGSTAVTTDATCSAPINNPVNQSQADLSVKLTGGYSFFELGPDWGTMTYTGTVTNNGPATAQSVVFTDALPAGLEISSAYCDVGACQTPVTTNLGACTVTNNIITCNLGTMAPGEVATVTIPVQATTAGSVSNTATVVSNVTPDPNLANNSSTLAETVDYPYPIMDHLDPAAILVNPSSDLILNVYGDAGFLPTSTVTFNGTAVNVVGFIDNQSCGSFTISYCADLQVDIPAAMLTTVGTPTVTVTNQGPGGGTTSATLTIASSCTYNVLNLDLSGTIDSGGTTLLSDPVEVTPNVSTCAWTATSSVPWAVIADNASATGSQTVDVIVAPNTDPLNSLTGSVTVAGQTFTFQEGPGATCSYALNPTSASFPATGGSGTIAVTSGCSGYFVTSYAPWITIASSSSLLSDNGTVSYTVAPNNGAAQTGTIAVGGQAFQVTQAAPSCYFTLSANSSTLPVAGGTGSIGVTASSPSCAWTSTSSNSSLVSITSGASGTGNGTVNFSAPANTEGPQTSTIAIGNQTGYATYTVNQASAFSCVFTLSPTSVNVSANGTSNNFTITPSYSNCQWTANSSDSTALSIVNSASGTGTGSVLYVVGQNTGAPRTLTITAGCQTFTINQAGTQASNPVPAITTLLPAGTTAGSGAFTLTVNGSGFINGSVVNFNGNARVTSYVSATQLTAAILATDVASVGTPAVTVTNPTPGGGTSNAVTFNVTAAPLTAQTITFANPGAQTVGTPLTLSATATSGLAVTFTSTTTGVCTVSGTTATFVAPGTCTIDANQGGNSTYSAAPQVPQSFAVNTAPLTAQTIAFANPGAQTVGTPLTLMATATSGLAVSFASATASICTVSGTTATFVVSGTCTIDATQAGNSTYAAAPMVAQSFTVNAAAPVTAGAFGSIPVGQTGGPIQLTFTLSGNGNIGSISAYMQGAPTTEFAVVSGGTCAAGMPYNAGNTCTANVNFSPKFAGLRYGAVIILDGSGNTIATDLVNGTGLGPQVRLLSTNERITSPAWPTSGGGLSSTGITVDGIGDVFVADIATHGEVTAKEVPVNCTSASCVVTLAPTYTMPAKTNLNQSMALDLRGNLFIATAAGTVYEITAASNYQTQTQLASSFAFGNPTGIAVDQSGNVFVATTGTSTNGVYEILAAGGYTTVNQVASGLTNPYYIASDGSGNLFVSTKGSEMYEILATGGYTSVNQVGGGFNFGLSSPAVAVDQQGNVFAMNYSTFAFDEILATGGYTAVDVILTGLSGAIAVDASGNFYMTNSGGSINKMEYTDAYVNFTTPTTAGSTDTTDAQQWVTVQNIGNASLNLTGIAPPSNFILDSSTTTCSTTTPLAAGTSCVVGVDFAPTTGGALTGTLTLTDNSLNVTGATQPIYLSGTATTEAQTITFANPGAQTVGTPLMLTATATSGLAVTFTSTTTGVCTVAGTTATFVAAGTCTIDATQAGNSTYAAAPMVAQSFTVSAAPLTAQTITFGNPGAQTVGTPLTLTATATSGLAVTFTSTTTGVCTVAGTTATFVATGTCTIDANQAGNSTYAAATMVAQSFTVDAAPPPPNFTVASPTGAQTVQPGGAATYTVNVTPVNGAFTGVVTLSASGLPAGATATFVPATVTPGSAGGSSQLTIQTPATRGEAAPVSPWPLAAPALALIGIFFVPGKRRRRWITLGVLLVVSLGAVAALSGCGGGFGVTSVTPPVSYNVTVTGTSGTDIQTTTVQLTVE